MIQKGKIIIKFAIIWALILSLVQEANAISYWGWVQLKAPEYVANQSLRKAFDWAYTVNGVSSYNSSYVVADPSTHWQINNANVPLYYNYEDWTFTDKYRADYETISKISFSGVTENAEYLISKYYISTLWIMTYWTLSGTSTITYNVKYVPSTGSFSWTDIYKKVFNLSESILTPTWWFKPLEVVIETEEIFWSSNSILGAKANLDLVSLTIIWSWSKNIETSFEWWLQIWNTFSNLGACWGFAGNKTTNTAWCYAWTMPFPYVPNAVYYRFNDQTTTILWSYSWSTTYHVNWISNFYNWWNIVAVTSTGSTGWGNTWWSGSIYYEDCGWFSDVWCYVKWFWNFIYASISWLFDIFLPDISFSWSFDSCGSYDTNTGSIMQKFANVIAIVNPIPIEDWWSVCTIWWAKTIEYSMLVPEQNFFEKYIPWQIPELEISLFMYWEQTLWDLITIFVFITIIFYDRKHD